MHPRAAYYTVNDNPKYVLMVRKSIESLRRFNRDLPIFLFLFGSQEALDLDFVQTLGVTLVIRPSIQGKPIRQLLLKWKALAAPELNCKALLFCDADTYFFGDPADLFDRYDSHDFYARQEAQCDADALFSPCIISWEMMARLRAYFSVKETPVFNTGLMVFNREAHRRIAAKLHLLTGFFDGLEQGRIPMPCRDYWLKEELAATFCLGALDDFDCGFLHREDAPFYYEYKEGHVSGPGLVMHTWAVYYPHFLKEFEGGLGAWAVYETVPHKPRFHRFKQWVNTMADQWYKWRMKSLQRRFLETDDPQLRTRP